MLQAGRFDGPRLSTQGVHHRHRHVNWNFAQSDPSLDEAVVSLVSVASLWRRGVDRVTP